MRRRTRAAAPGVLIQRQQRGPYSKAHWFSRRTSSSSSGVKSFCAHAEQISLPDQDLRTGTIHVPPGTSPLTTMLNVFLISSGVLPVQAHDTAQRLAASQRNA